MEQTSLGKRIMAHRKRLGLTQDQLAEKLGVTAQAVSKWENDLSCPDITMLPKLAQIFGVTTDALLGNEAEPLHEAQVVRNGGQSGDNSGGKKHDFSFSFNSKKKGAIGFAVLVLLVGALLLAANLLKWEVGFGDILWPSALLVLGLFGLYPRFSFFSLACTLCGSFFLLSNLNVLQADFHGVLFPVLLLLLGVSLLIDALRKSRKPAFFFTFNSDKDDDDVDDSDDDEGSLQSDYSSDEDSFAFHAKFGSSRTRVDVAHLRHGQINVAFGDYTLDLSEVASVTNDCVVDSSCSFGELTLLVPSRFRVRSESNTAFAGTTVSGAPDIHCEGTITLSGSVHFGGISIKYI